MFGGIASAIGSIAGGLLSKSSADSVNAFAREQFEYQKALHKNQLQWRVEDAKKAGLHPLAGLGISSYSFSPASMTPSSYDFSGLGAVGDALDRMGQNANVEKQRDKDAKARAQAEALAADTAQAQLDLIRSQIESQRADTDLRRFELASRMRRSTDPTQIGPPAPSTRGVQGATIDGQEQSANKYPDVPMYSFGVDDKGRKVTLMPSEERAEMWSDVPIIGSLGIHAGAGLKNWAAKLFGQEVEGYYWDSEKGYIKEKPKRKSVNIDRWLSRRSGGYY